MCKSIELTPNEVYKQLTVVKEQIEFLRKQIELNNEKAYEMELENALIHFKALEINLHNILQQLQSF